jgi:hypothetical protein
MVESVVAQADREGIGNVGLADTGLAPVLQNSVMVCVVSVR